jgi:hypothetical protein
MNCSAESEPQLAAELVKGDEAPFGFGGKRFRVDAEPIPKDQSAGAGIGVVRMSGHRKGALS